MRLKALDHIPHDKRMGVDVPLLCGPLHRLQSPGEREIAELAEVPEQAKLKFSVKVSGLSV